VSELLDYSASLTAAALGSGLPLQRM